VSPSRSSSAGSSSWRPTRWRPSRGAGAMRPKSSGPRTLSRQ
jgi:hypothetical protein